MISPFVHTIKNKRENIQVLSWQFIDGGSDGNWVRLQLTTFIKLNQDNSRPPKEKLRGC